MLTTSRDGNESIGPRGVGIALNFNLFEHFDGDMDAFVRHARVNGTNVSGPIDQPWNVREATVLDLDGYKLVFTVPININLAFNDVIKQASRENDKE